MVSDGDTSSWSSSRRDRQHDARRRDHDQTIRRLDDLDYNLEHIFKKFEGMNEMLSQVLAGQSLIMNELHVDIPSPSTLPPMAPPPVHFTIFDESDVSAANSDDINNFENNHEILKKLDDDLLETFNKLDEMLQTKAATMLADLPCEPHCHSPVGQPGPQAPHSHAPHSGAHDALCDAPVVLCLDASGQEVMKGSQLIFHSQEFGMRSGPIHHGVAACYCAPYGYPDLDPELFFDWSAGRNSINPKTAKFEVVSNS